MLVICGIYRGLDVHITAVCLLNPPLSFPCTSQVGNLISQTPDLSFPIGDQAQTWLLTTYLDEDTRITRGDGGSVFILVKDVSITPIVIEPPVETAVVM